MTVIYNFQVEIFNVYQLKRTLSWLREKLWCSISEAIVSGGIFNCEGLLDITLSWLAFLIFQDLNHNFAKTTLVFLNRINYTTIQLTPLLFYLSFFHESDPHFNISLLLQIMHCLDWRFNRGDILGGRSGFNRLKCNSITDWLNI